MRIGIYMNLSIEGACRGVIQYAFVMLIAGAVGTGMFNDRVVIHMLQFIGEIESQRIGFSPFACHLYMQVIPDHPPVKGYGAVLASGRTLLGNPGIGHLA